MGSASRAAPLLPRRRASQRRAGAEQPRRCVLFSATCASAAASASASAQSSACSRAAGPRCRPGLLARPLVVVSVATSRTLFPRRAHRLWCRHRRRHRRRLAVERQARVAVLALLAHPLVVVSVATTHAGARFLDAADDLALRGRTPRSWPRTSPLVRRRRRSTSTKAASRSSCPPEAREGCRAPVARSPAPRAPPAQVIQELLRYAAMQLHVPGMRSRGPLRERTKSICGMVCGCNDRKHCVAGPDPPRTAGLSIIRTCQHKASNQHNPGRLKIRAARIGSTYASTPHDGSLPR